MRNERLSEKSEKYKFREFEGITLISLVITIIILIILSGIVINLSLGENGLFNRTLYARDKTRIEDAEEIIKLIVLENEIVKNEENQSGYLANNQLIEKIIKQLKDKGHSVQKDNDTIIYGEEQIKISDYLEKKKFYKVNVKAPKNSIVVLKYSGREIGKIDIDSETKTGNTNIYKEIGDKLTAQCKLNDEVIYEKTFELQENATINMYPCEENGDGKALYWYGMEFTNFETGQVKYGSNSMQVLGTFNKKDNNMNLYMNDTYKTQAVGIGVYCKENITNYNNIEIKVENIEYTGYAESIYLVGDIANNYHESYVKKAYQESTNNSNSEIKIPSDGIKNIKVEDIEGEQYISIINFNPSGSGSLQNGSLNMDIVSIILK